MAAQERPDIRAGAWTARPSQRRRDPLLDAPAAPEQPVPFWSAISRSYGASAQDQVMNRTGGMRRVNWLRVLEERDDEIERITGRRLRPTLEMQGLEIGPDADGFDLLDFINTPIRAAARSRTQTVADYERELEALKARYPELADIPTRAGLRRQYETELQEVRRSAERASSAGVGGAVGGFAGGTAAAMGDPVNLAVTAWTGGLGAGRDLLMRMGMQAVANTSAEAAQIPGRIGDVKFGGPEYSAGEAGADVAMAGVGAAGFEGLGDLVGFAGRNIARHFEQSPQAADRGLADQIERLLDDEAIIGQGAADFDAARQAVNTGDLPAEGPPELDLEALFDTPSATPRNDMQPGTADAAPPPSALERADYMGRAIYAGRFDPLQVEADPARFQYKADGDAEGVTGRLRGFERWDATASGKAILFEAADGRIIVADGHQRRGLARRLAEQGWEDARLDGYLFREADGWSARDVRVVAALKNIREGSGAILDAAKLFREAPAALRDRSLPVTGDFIHQARQLASLSDDAFSAVINGTIPERYAAVIGEQAGARPELHGDLIELVRRGEPRSVEGARALVQEGLLDDFIKSEGRQMDLFGGLPRESTVIARGRIREAVMGNLRKDEKLNAALVRNAEAIEAGGNVLARSENEKRLAVDRAASELVSRLALRSGDMGEAFAAAATAVTRGELTPAAAAKGLTARIRAAVAAGERLDEVRAQVIDPPPPSAQALEAARAFDQPGGRGQEAQIQPKPEDARLENHEPEHFEKLDLATRTEAEARALVESERAAVEAEVLATQDLSERVEAARQLIDTRGGGIQYHGARAEIASLNEAYYNPDNIYGGWETFYTTDATEIAAGYGRKRASAKVYEVREREAVMFFDMEDVRTEAEWREFLGVSDDSHDFDQFAIEQAVADNGGRANLRQVMDEYRGSSQEYGFSKDDVQEIFSDLTDRIQAAGFGGMRHIGGLKTNRRPHEVKIYLRPHEQIELAEVSPARGDAPDAITAELQQAQVRLEERKQALSQMETELQKLQADLRALESEGPPPGLFDDLTEDVAHDRAVNVLRACAPGKGG